MNYDFYVKENSRFNFQISHEIRQVKRSDLKAVFEVDFSITGEKRYEMLKQYSSYMYLIFNNIGKPMGFSITGPDIFTTLSIDPIFGLELVKNRLNSGHKKFVIPETNTFLKEFLLANGFIKNCQLQKMVLGKRIRWNPEGVFNRGAGYCG